MVSVRRRPPPPAPFIEPLQVALTDVAHRGEALGRAAGQVVFAAYGIPGEEATVLVEHAHKSFLEGRVERVATPSPHRVAAPCPYFGRCGGCQWQHVDYPFQLALKERVVREELRRLGHFDEPPVAPVLGAPEPWHYRNHARFTVGRRGDVGFVARNGRTFIPIERCLIMHPTINAVLADMQGHCPPVHQLSVRVGVNTGSLLIQPKLPAEECAFPTGQSAYQELFLGERFHISSPSFFQVNVAQAEALARLVLECLNLQGGETVVDAYAGVGTFARLLAPRVRQVIAVEEAASAAGDALINLGALANVRYLTGKAEELLPELGQAPDAVILDPPRAGCDPKVIQALLARRPRRVAYVSCDPATLARDLRVLVDGGYALRQVQPVDMFPQTYHIECVATLEWPPEAPRANGAAAPVAARAPLVLASASPRRKELLPFLDLAFETEPAEGVEEGSAEGGGPEAPLTGSGQGLAVANALAKARQVAAGAPEKLALAADTVVVDNAGAVLGKPRDAAEARAMLLRLRGKEHDVVTGLAFVHGARGIEATSHEATRVRMRDYSDDEIEAYVASGDPLDKAGAYAIQSQSFHPVESWEVCYQNVVGLPLCALLDLLRAQGVAAGGRPLWALPPECRACPQAGRLTTGRAGVLPASDGGR
ncbi:MAG: 23S rRNA (uracil(1939)-C(5))-methyltransferase RlmD [Chloroflexi bacterium]|nr:23S rRNA (uracil(1939)-C(5))-methyltransferase RlmD [Chloroflexota bacterium]